MDKFKIDNSHPQITKWARQKYPNANIPEDAKIIIEMESFSDGYCETCWSSWDAFVVYYEDRGNRVKLEEMSQFVEVSDLINEILSA